MELNKLIDKKVVEHQVVLDAVLHDIERLRIEVGAIKQDKTRLPEMASQAQKLMVLKDKVMFHKAAILVLQDLKEDVNVGE